MSAHGSLGITAIAAALLTAAPVAAKDTPQTFNRAYQAAVRGDTAGEVIVARDYWNGAGVKSDPATALFWTKRAAMKRNGEAEAMLANAYARGLAGEPQDWVWAFGLFELSAEDGYSDSAVALAGMESQMTDAEKQQAQADCDYWKLHGYHEP